MSFGYVPILVRRAGPSGLTGRLIGLGFTPGGFHQTAYVAGSANAFCFLIARTKGGWVLPVTSSADDLLDLDAAQGFDAVGHQMQEFLPLYGFHLAAFHIGENESRHLVGDFKLRFAGNLDIDFFSHFAPR